MLRSKLCTNKRGDRSGKQQRNRNIPNHQPASCNNNCAHQSLHLQVKKKNICLVSSLLGARIDARLVAVAVAGSVILLLFCSKHQSRKKETILKRTKTGTIRTPPPIPNAPPINPATHPSAIIPATRSFVSVSPTFGGGISVRLVFSF